jgi:hypothetical protein
MVETRYLGPTNHRGGRIVAKCLGSGKRLTVAWDHSHDNHDNHEHAARLLLAGIDANSLALGMDGGRADAHLLFSAVDGGGYVWAVVPPGVTA